MQVEHRRLLARWLVVGSCLAAAPLAGCDHVEAVRCAEDTDCLKHINEAVVASMRANVRNTSDPCSNFWDYACGEWTAAPYYDHVDTFGAIDNFYSQQLQHLLADTNANTLTDITVSSTDVDNLLDRLRTYYNACRNAGKYFLDLGRYFESLPAKQDIPLWPNMSAILAQPKAWLMGGEYRFDWLRSVAELRRFGLNGVFFDQVVGMAYNDSTKYVIELKAPDEVENFPNKYDFVHYFEDFGWVEQRRTDHVALAADIFALETGLQELRRRQTQRVEKTGGQDDEQPLTLSDLKHQVPSIDWQTYFNVVLDVPLASAEMPIEVVGLTYLREVAALLHGTDGRVVCLYVMMRLCKFLVEVSPQITDRNCVEHTSVAMPLGVDYIYDRFVYRTRREDERVLQSIFTQLKAQFAGYMHMNAWGLRAEQLHYMRTKLVRMRLRVGNLPLHMPPEYYDHFYDGVNLSETNFFRNHWEMLRFRTQQQHKVLAASEAALPLDPDAFYVNDDINQVRNAPYFVHQRNLLIVPFVFLQMPFYHHRVHPLLQYSLVGWILGHELNHAFDTDGIELDADGNECVDGTAASIKAKHRWTAALQCLTRHPTSSLNERLADVNGFQLAYDAFFHRVWRGTKRLEASAEFTAGQLYFLSFAQFFCGSLPPPIAHDRDDVRVNEIVANMPEFATAFNCEPGRSETPVEKCQMWRN